MQNELKEKLQKLSEKFNTDLDVISLKALCIVPENEQILFAITGTLNRLIEKYPDDEEIQGLLPKKEKISLENLILALQETYSNNVEVFTIKVLSTFPEEELREKAINQSLERLLEANPNDENILEYLEIEEVTSKEQNPDMIFVERGRYIPTFFNEERGVCDLYVSKYQTTQIRWREMMGTDPSNFKGDRRPVEQISWIEALEYCNKLSEHYGLQPVYKIENDKLVAIIHNDGKEVYPDLADFSKTEGYRLPTELEWEWFARGGKIAQEKGTFDTKYAGDEYSDRVAWLGRELNSDNTTLFYGNSQNKLHDIGLLKPNELKLYDLSGNVDEFCYDSYSDSNIYIDEKNSYYYDSVDEESIIRGGNFKDDEKIEESDDFAVKVVGGIFGSFSSALRSALGPSNTLRDRHSNKKDKGNLTTGFRVVRTANPKR